MPSARRGAAAPRTNRRRPGRPEEPTPAIERASVPVRQAQPDRRQRRPTGLRDRDIRAAGMRKAERTDGHGRKQYVLLPASEPDTPAAIERGALLGPPPLVSLGLPLSLEVALNNELFNRGIITEADARARFREIVGAWQAVLATGAAKIHAVYVDAGT